MLSLEARQLPRVVDVVSEGIADASASTDWCHAEESAMCGGAGAPGLHNPETDVIHRSEVISPDNMLALLRAIYVAMFLGFVAVAVVFSLKVSGAMKTLRDTKPVLQVNAFVGAVQVTVLAFCLSLVLFRVRTVAKAKLRWSSRRWRLVVLHTVQLCAVLFGSIFFLVPNAHAARKSCGYFETLISWSGVLRAGSRNTIFALFVVQARSYNLWVDKQGLPAGKYYDSILLDAPLRGHLHLGFYWLLVLVWDLYVIILPVIRHGTRTCDLDNPSACHLSNFSLFKSVVVCLWYLGYLVLFLFYVRRGFLRIREKPYNQFCWVLLSLRYLFRTVGLTILFSAFSVGFYWLADPSACVTFITGWFGLLPVQLTLTVFAVLDTALGLPIKPGSRVKIVKQLESYKWTEQEDLLNDDSSGTVQDVGSQMLCSNSCFQFETAVKLVYWCDFIYEYNPTTRQATPPFSLELALSLFDLYNFKYIEEKTMDTHTMIAWNLTTVLLCFRGTYSPTNIAADLKLWRCPHHPKKDSSWIRRRPMVHIGFHQSWRSHDLDRQVVSFLTELMNDPKFERERMRVLVCGHSLGGALAVLAAEDIRRCCSVQPHQLSCYTFGCPRVGNHDFVMEYNKAVPETWHIINNLDAVARMPKFGWLFKQTGKRVVVNSRGDLIVSPSIAEFNMMSAFMGKLKVADHLLTSYRKALASVVLAQFHKQKAQPGGRAAMTQLFRNGEIEKVLGIRKPADWQQGFVGGQT